MVTATTNRLSLWIMHGADGEHGRQIVPGVEHKNGDYAELIDADGNPIAHGYNPHAETMKWWTRACHADGTGIWLMPFEAWRILRDKAATDTLNDGVTAMMVEHR